MDCRSPTQTQSDRPSAARPPACGLDRFGTPPSMEEYPNWRYLIAEQLAQQAEDQPPHHDDPWIQDTAELLHVNRHKIPDFAGTTRQRHIRDALLLPQQGALVIKVLECRLVAGPSLEELARHCHLSRGVLEAYAAALCDVDDHRRVQAWNRQQLNPSNYLRGPVGLVTTVLQRTLMFEAGAGVEAAVRVLCRLAGPTLAERLPPAEAPPFLEDFSRRATFAEVLLPRNKTNSRLLHRLEQTRQADAPGTLPSAKTIDIGLQILRRVKIPRALQRELERLRELCRWPPGSFPNWRCDADGNGVDGNDADGNSAACLAAATSK